jgi:hypothetical protein
MFLRLAQFILIKLRGAIIAAAGDTKLRASVGNVTLIFVFR